MHSFIQDFPNQLEDALSRFCGINIKTLQSKQFTNIVCAGMGGSGIAASLLQAIFMQTSSLPYIITKSYELPALTNQHTLFLACSHSGNTEETITTTKLAYQAGATVVVISSGGYLLEFAKQHNLLYIQLPDAMMPRACYTYAVVAQLCLFSSLGMIPSYYDAISLAISLIVTHQDNLKEQANKLANILHHKIPVLYSDDLFAPIAMRARQQYNENSKVLCRHAILPEMNHNEILGRYDKYDTCAVIFLRHDYEHPRTTYRMQLTQEIISSKVASMSEVRGIGDDMIQQMFTMIYILDWTSVYLADLRDIDPTEIETIIYLKDQLSKHPL